MSVKPRPVPKYLGLGPAFKVLTGTVKRNPSALATSPPPQAWAMGEPIALERRDACVNQGSQSNIAGFRDQHRAQTCRQVAHSTLALTNMGELREKARSHMQLQHEFGQIDGQKAPSDTMAQELQACWLVDFV